jgi:hypothetical protein
MGTQSLPDSWRRPTNSLQSYQGMDPIKVQALTVAAKRLFSQFKTDATVEPKTYLVAVIELFSHYSPEVVMTVTHPFTGMASKQNWLPTIFEIRKACDEANAPAPRSVTDTIAETFARRRQDEQRLLAKPSEESRTAHVERLRAEGKLAFAGARYSQELPWFERLTKSEAQATLDRFAGEVRKDITDELFANLEAAENG